MVKKRSWGMIITFLLLLVGLVLWGMATREEITEKPFLIVCAITFGSIAYAHWKKKQHDYEEHPQDKYHTSWASGAFIIYLLTGSYGLWLFGGIVWVAFIIQIYEGSE